MKKLFEVANVSGHSFGLIAAESENGALDLVSKEVTGTNELVAEEVDIEELVESWVNQFMEDNPDFRCMAQSQLSQVIANSNAPAFPKLPEEYINEAHDIAWELFMAFWKKQVLEEVEEMGLDMEKLDPTGAGIDDWIIWRALKGTPVADAIADWVDWKLGL